jgi:hypothetical protein
LTDERPNRRDAEAQRCENNSLSASNGERVRVRCRNSTQRRQGAKAQRNLAHSGI